MRDILLDRVPQSYVRECVCSAKHSTRTHLNCCCLLTRWGSDMSLTRTTSVSHNGVDLIQECLLLRPQRSGHGQTTSSSSKGEGETRQELERMEISNSCPALVLSCGFVPSVHMAPPLSLLMQWGVFSTCYLGRQARESELLWCLGERPLTDSLSKLSCQRRDLKDRDCRVSFMTHRVCDIGT